MAPTSIVEIWQVDLKSDFSINPFFAYLDNREKQKALKFKTKDLCRRYVIAHTALRCILSRHLNKCPHLIRFTNQESGRPIIDSEQNTNNLHFSLSHSYEMAILAVSRNQNVGVDIEYFREILQIHKIVRRFFSPIELNLFLQTPPQFQNQLFFKLWTAKEAFLKGNGLGISGNLPRFSIQLDNNHNQFGISHNKISLTSWQLYRLTINQQYEGTLATNNAEKTELVYREFNLRENRFI